MRNKRRPLAELFNEDPPIIHFANGDFLVFHELFEVPKGAARISFDAKKVLAWDWKDVNLKKNRKDPRRTRRQSSAALSIAYWLASSANGTLFSTATVKVK